MGARHSFRLWRRSTAAVLGFMTWSGFSAASAQSESVHTVLGIQWSTEDFPGVARIDDEIRHALQSRKDLAIDYFTEYLETDRFPEDGSEALRDYIRRKFSTRPIDVVIANSSPALVFARAHHEELFPRAPIVYLGFQIAPPANSSADSPALTGVLTGATYSGTLALALRLHPSAERVVVVAQSPVASAGMLARVQAALREFEPQVALTYI